MSEQKEVKAPWFKDGVKFTCQEGCVRCCGGGPGYVWVTDEEIAGIAGFLKMTVPAFERMHVRPMSDGRKSLKERSNYDCVLLESGGCGVYSVRPKQCRDYPFWPEVMASPLAWAQEMSRCPGIGEGTVHEAPKLLQILRSQADFKE